MNRKLNRIKQLKPAKQDCNQQMGIPKTDSLKLAEQQLLEPGGLSHTDLEKVLHHLMGPSVDQGDLYFQNTSHEAWSLEDGLVRSGTHAVEQGVGIRAVSGEKTGFAYADEIIMPSLMQASTAARSIARQGSQAAVQAWRRQQPQALFLPDDPMPVLSADQKVDLLRQIDTGSLEGNICKTMYRHTRRYLDPETGMARHGREALGYRSHIRRQLWL